MPTTPSGSTKNGLKTTKRAEQNRKAQQAFRDRQKVKERAKDLKIEQQNGQINELEAKLQQFQQYTERLRNKMRARNVSVSPPPSPFLVMRPSLSPNAQ